MAGRYGSHRFQKVQDGHWFHAGLPRPGDVPLTEQKGFLLLYIFNFWNFLFSCCFFIIGVCREGVPHHLKVEFTSKELLDSAIPVSFKPTGLFLSLMKFVSLWGIWFSNGIVTLWVSLPLFYSHPYLKCRWKWFKFLVFKVKILRLPIEI